MHRLKTAFVAVVIFGALPAAPRAQTATGRVTGTIFDQHNGLKLPGVTVEVTGTKHVAQTDMDGRFLLQLPVGSRELSIALDGYGPKKIEVDVTARQTVTVDVTLGLAGYSELVTVVGDVMAAETSTAEAQLLERKRATTILDNMGAQEMRANADTNAAAALQRVTGLSVVDNQYVFVRGLGERYSNTTLNGATIPSTEPERKVVSLDLFPAGLLDSVTVVKSYSPDRPAEFAGGLIEIVPAKLPDRRHFDVSYSVGVNSQTFGKEVLEHAAGDRDWLGMSNGDRALPASFPNRRLIRGGLYTPELGVTRHDLETFGEAFDNSWTPQVTDGDANQGFGAAFARRFGRVGLLASVNQSYRHQYQEEVQNYYRTEEASGLTPFSEYDYRVGSNRGTLAGLFGFSAQFTPQQRLGVQAFGTTRGERETRTFEGYNSDVGENLRNSRLLWREENLRSAQVTGDHLFQGLSNSTIEWRLTASRSSRDEPDVREMLYEEIGGTYQFVDESQSAFHMFTDLDEDTLDLSASWNVFFTAWNGLPTMLKAGQAYSRRQRDFSARRFRFLPIDTRGINLSAAPEELFAAENVGPVFELREDTRATDFYGAELTNTAFFGLIDLPLANKWRLVGGARIERFDQRVDTFDLFDVDVDGQSQAIQARIRKTDVFPAANLVYAVRADHNIRLGFSQTVNRPEFRELAPFEFTDIVGGRAVVGNPELTRALIRNYDLRWEWFPGAEQLVAASFFFKDFENPIERFVEPTAQLRTSFTNAESARNLGVELEARRRIGRHVLVGGNYTFVDSQITLTESQTNVLTSLSRSLYGTSRHMFNGLAEVRNNGTSARVLVNFVGDRVADVGSLGLPDIVEQGRPTIDLIASQRLGRLNLRFSVENLNDSAVEFVQQDQLQRRYKTGRLVLLQVGYAAF